MNIPTVFFDEAGNTGSDLLNKEQKVFVLCSTDITEENAKALLSNYFDTSKQIHFKKLKTSNSGKASIIKFFDEQMMFLNDVCFTTAFNKEYMIMCQILNYLVEPQLFDAGIDYYDEGNNIAHANMMYLCMPAFVGKENTFRFYSSFVEMVKNPDKEHIDTFYECVGNLIQNCNTEDYKQELQIIALSRNEIDTTLQSLTKYSVDPSMSALIDLSGRWNYKYQDGFNIIHDRSNNINSQIEILDFLRNLDIESTEVGYGEVKVKYPLKIYDFTFSESSSSYVLQLCDIVASALCYVANSIVKGQSTDFSSKLDSIIKEWKYSSIIGPSNDVKPDIKRKKVNGQINPIDFIAYQMYKNGNKEL
jgi:hypothetical protein